MGRYVLGLDGGGTKTLAQALNEDGTPLFRVGGGALNLNSESPDRVRAVIREILQQAEQYAGRQPDAVCIAAAGTSNPAAAQALLAAAQDAGCSAPVQVTGDHMAALTGALGRSEGLILISGTGSICVGRTADGREARAGGFGHLIDDEGSGYAMGRDVLRAVMEAWDGRGPETCLTQQVYKALDAHSPGDIVSFVYAPDRPKRDIAALARLLPRAAAQHDAAALSIYDRAARELVRLAATVVRRLELERGEMALAGSALINDVFLRECLSRELIRLELDLSVVLPRNDAAWGAALLAQEMLQ